MMKKQTRRDFLKTTGAATLAAMLPRVGHTAPKEKMIWANLLHLSFNMWEDWPAPGKEMRYFRPYLRFDEKLWDDLLEKMAAAKMNMVVIDLGDGVRYDSHPEIAVKNAWNVEKLRSELRKMRDMGLEPIPKLNFASSHDAWLGEYSRRLSTDKYYEVCADLIAEVTEIFDKPRFFHLGMDEETAGHQKYYQYVVVRQYDLWWKDFLFLQDEVKKAGSRPWIWSDYLWRHPEDFFEKMPKDVLQSNWYYGTKFGDDKMVKAYDRLEEHGFDQIPTASNHSHPENFRLTMRYCTNHISQKHLKGFLQTPWRPTIAEYRDHHLEAIEVVGTAIRKYGG